MNVFSKFADIDQGIITMVLGDIKQATEDTKTAPNKTRGAPDGKSSGEIFTLSNDYLKQVHKDDRHYFNRTLANKTKDIKEGQHKRIEINGAKRVYFFVADGYMSGEIVKSISNKRPNLYMKAREEFYATIEQSGEGADIWSEFDYLVERGSAEDAGYFGYGRTANRNDTFSQESPSSYGKRSERPNVEYNDNPQESKELIEKLREKYGIREGKTSRELDADYLSAVERGDMETAQRMVDEAKLRATSELDNLIDAGFNFRNVPDGQDGHIHRDVVGGFEHFDVIFKVGKEYYQGVISIKNIKRGKLLKDITKIKNITNNMTSRYGDFPSYAFVRDVSMNSISQNSDLSTQIQK